MDTLTDPAVAAQLAELFDTNGWAFKKRPPNHEELTELINSLIAAVRAEPEEQLTLELGRLMVRKDGEVVYLYVNFGVIA